MFKARFKEDSPLELSFSSNDLLGVRFSDVQTVYTGIRSGTKEYWDEQRSLIGEKNIIYVYTDHQTKTDTWGRVTNIPGIKIGDGKAYLIDLPFTDDIYITHIKDMAMHCTQEEKDLWNNKVRAFVSRIDPTNLIFTTK